MRVLLKSTQSSKRRILDSQEYINEHTDNEWKSYWKIAYIKLNFLFCLLIIGKLVNIYINVLICVFPLFVRFKQWPRFCGPRISFVWLYYNISLFCRIKQWPRVSVGSVAFVCIFAPYDMHNHLSWISCVYTVYVNHVQNNRTFTLHWLIENVSFQTRF